MSFINTLDNYQLVFGILLVCAYFAGIAKFTVFALGYGENKKR